MVGIAGLCGFARVCVRASGGGLMPLSVSTGQNSWRSGGWTGRMRGFLRHGTTELCEGAAGYALSTDPVHSTRVLVQGHAGAYRMHVHRATPAQPPAAGRASASRQCVTFLSVGTRKPGPRNQHLPAAQCHNRRPRASLTTNAPLPLHSDSCVHNSKPPSPSPPLPRPTWPRPA